MKRFARGFGIIEVLFVLAVVGMVATQVTHDRRDAREMSIASTLQTLRSQIELYKIQHADMPPPATALWTQLLHASNTTGRTTAGNTTREYPLGPYLLAAPVNPANGQNGFGAAANPQNGWVYQVDGPVYTLQAVNTTGNAVLPY